METDDAVNALGYEVVDLGCCKVVSHAKWGTHAFLATIFTTAPLSTFKEAFQKVENEWSPEN